MITIYRPDETDFSRNGLGAIDKNVIDPVVSETLNGMYMFTFKYPIFAPKGQYMKGESILKAPTPKGLQLFRIHKEEPSMGYTEITAYHIFYDLAFNWIDDTNIVGKTGTAAGNQILGATNYLHSFEFVSDIAVAENARIVAMNGVQAFLDSSKDNTFVSRWGGEIDRNNFQIRMLREVGEDRHVTIEYRKDLLKYTSSVDWSTVVTRLKPVGFNGLELPEIFIDSPLIANYPYPKVGRIEYKQVKAAIGEYADDEDAIPLEDAYTELRRLAALEFSQAELDRPTATYTVVFAPLMETKEYKKYAALQRIYIGDTVKVKHAEEGIDLTAKVISYEYNPMTKAYTEITLGSVQQTLSGTTYKNLQSQIDDIKQVELSNLEQSIDRATGLINTAMGGHVLKRNGELLIMDTEDITTAVKIWRWNLNGLGYSGTGYAGPYRTAITNDGHFVADFIDVGLLKAEMIQAGFNGIAEGVSMDASGLKVVGPGGEYSVVENGGMSFYALDSSKTGSIESGYNTADVSNGVSIFLQPGKFFTVGRKQPNGKYDRFINVPYDKDEIRLQKPVSVTSLNIAGTNQYITNMSNQGGVFFDTVRVSLGTGTLDAISVAITAEPDKAIIHKPSFFNNPLTIKNASSVLGGKIFDYADTLLLGGAQGTNVGYATAEGGVMSVMRFQNGEIRAYATLNMNGNVITNQSDIRLKDKVMDAVVDPFSVIEKMRFINFEWDATNPYNEKKPTGEQFGIEAQYAPFLAVKDQGSNYLSIDMGKQVNINSMALQRMIAEIKTLKEENAETKKELADLKQLLIEKGVI